MNENEQSEIEKIDTVIELMKELRLMLLDGWSKKQFKSEVLVSISLLKSLISEDE